MVQNAAANQSEASDAAHAAHAANADASVLLVIRAGENGDIEMPVLRSQLPQLSMAELRRQVRTKIGGQTLNRRLRFIYQGKVLPETTQLGRDVIGTAPERKKVFLLFSVGSLLTPEELRAGDDLDNATSAGGATNGIRSVDRERRGFDRLRSAGFSDDEVDQLRRQFGEFYGEGTRDQVEREEQWLNTGVNQAPSSQLAEVIAFAIGAFSGVFLIVILKLVPFPRYNLRSMILGAGLNVAVTILRSLV